MVACASPLPRTDLFYTGVDIMALVYLLFASSLLAPARTGAEEQLLCWPHSSLIKSAFCPLPQVSRMLIYQYAQVNKIEDYLLL